MKKLKVTLSLFLAVTMVISLLAMAPPAAAETTAEDAQKVIKVGMFEQPDYLNPILASSVSSWEFINWMYDPLIRWDDDWGVTGGLAESWEWAENGTQLTLNLVQNATWHDGTPFTSADVNWTLFTWTWLGWWVGQTPRIDHRNILCPDNYTIVLNFVESGYESIWAWTAAAPYYYYRDSYDGTPVEVNKEAFLTGLTYVPILPAHLWDPITWNDPIWGIDGYGYGYYDVNETWIDLGYWAYSNWDGISWSVISPTFDTPEIGTGPFILTAYEPGEYAYLEANPNYQWGTPNVDNITVLFYTSVETMTQALRAGEIDFCPTSATLLETGTYGPEVTVNENSYLGWTGLLINQDWYYANNTDAFALREQSVKDAINQAVNKTKVANIAYLGHAQAADSVINSDLKWYNDALVTRTAGATAARATLEADGWVEGTGGVYEKTLNGTTKTLSFTLKYVSGDPIDLSTVQLLEADLQAAGFDITLQPEDVTTFTDDLGAYNFDLLVTFYSQLPDPNSMCQYMTSTSWLNPTMLNVPRIDEIYKEQQLAADAARETLIDEFQQEAYDEGSVVVLVEFNDIELYRNDAWEFTHKDWKNGILSMWNWMSWIEATQVTSVGFPLSIELIAVVAIGAIIVIGLVVWRMRK
ncbi:MAG: ABC transporter substrate-binding protein [Candidatus Thorarchaeota archaeon]